MSTGVAAWGGRSIAAEVNVDGMAAIVRTMVAGERVMLEDGNSLDEQIRRAGLARHERVALEALRLRLRDETALQTNDFPTTWY